MEDNACTAIEDAMSVFGRAWASAVLDALLHGAERFTEVAAATPGATDTTVSRRLKELVEAGFVDRIVDDGPPTQVRYVLTATGRDTRPVLDALRAFGARHPTARDAGVA